jgi:hypothetical protein
MIFRPLMLMPMHNIRPQLVDITGLRSFCTTPRRMGSSRSQFLSSTGRSASPSGTPSTSSACPCSAGANVTKLHSCLTKISLRVGSFRPFKTYGPIKLVCLSRAGLISQVLFGSLPKSVTP